MSSSAEAPVAIKFDHVTKTYKLYENDRQRFSASLAARRQAQAHYQGERQQRPLF